MPVALGFIETNSLIGAFEASNVMAKTYNIILLGKEVITPDLITIKIIGEKESVESAITAGTEAIQKLEKNFTSHIIVDPDEQMLSVMPEINGLYFSLKKYSKKKIKKHESGKIKTEVEKPEQDTKEFKKLKIEEPKIEKIEPEIEKIAVSEQLPQKDNTAAEYKPEKKLKKVRTDKKLIEEKIPEIKEKKRINYRNDTIERLRREALGLNKPERKKPVSKGIKKKKETKSKIKSKNNEPGLESLNVHQLRKLARSKKNFPILGREISKAKRDLLLEYFKNLK